MKLPEWSTKPITTEVFKSLLVRFIFALSLVIVSGLSLSYIRIDETKHNTKDIIELKSNDAILFQNDERLKMDIQRKVDYNVFDSLRNKDIEVYRNLRDSSLMIVKKMCLEQAEFLKRVDERFEREDYHNNKRFELILKYIDSKE